LIVVVAETVMLHGLEHELDPVVGAEPFVV
jgi:hypothetical protein